MIRWHVVTLAILTAVICTCLAFHHLGANSIFGDEAIAANIARSAAFDGHWYPLGTENGRYLSKPPLSIWPIALRFAIAGASEFNARIGSAAGGVFVSMLLFALGTWLVDARAGALAALLLITAPPWLLDHGVREGVGDVWTTLFTGLALLLYVRARVTESRRLLLAAIAAAAAGSLIKGPVVFLILAGVGVLWEVTAKLMLGRRPRWRALCVLVFASAIPFALWVADNAIQGAGARARMWPEFIGRHLHAIDPTHLRGGFMFYPHVLAEAFGVWLIALLLPLLWKWVRTSETALLLPLWALFPIAAFSFSVSKLPWYLDPALPPFALLIGIAVFLGIAQLGSRWLRYSLVAIVVGLLAMRVVTAWNATNATRQTEMHRLLLAYRSAERPILYVDLRPTASYGYREWNYYYLNLAKTEWRTIPAAIDRSRCSTVVTMRPARLMGRPDFADAQTRLLRKYDSREADLYVIDLCGGRFTRALAN